MTQLGQVSQEKLDSVFNFIKPKTQKQMKQFLGLANYFHHSTIVTPLQRLIEPSYTRRVGGKIIDWSSTADEAYEIIRLAIRNFPNSWTDDIYTMNSIRVDSYKTD